MKPTPAAPQAPAFTIRSNPVTLTIARLAVSGILSPTLAQVRAFIPLGQAGFDQAMEEALTGGYITSISAGRLRFTPAGRRLQETEAGTFSPLTARDAHASRRSFSVSGRSVS